jgi:hypothetical protein
LGGKESQTGDFWGFGMFFHRKNLGHRCSNRISLMVLWPWSSCHRSVSSRGPPGPATSSSKTFLASSWSPVAHGPNFCRIPSQEMERITRWCMVAGKDTQDDWIESTVGQNRRVNIWRFR